MRPRWEPGTAHSYHAATYGYLIGEVIRRITGRTVGTFLREEVCGRSASTPGSACPELDDRCAEVCNQSGGFDSVRVRRYESPAGNGHTNGRSLARIFGALACGGEVDGIRLISQATLNEAIAHRVTGPWIGFDENLLEPNGPIPRGTFGLRFARGFMRGSEMSWMGPNPGAFGSPARADRSRWPTPRLAWVSVTPRTPTSGPWQASTHVPVGFSRRSTRRSDRPAWLTDKGAWIRPP